MKNDLPNAENPAVNAEVNLLEHRIQPKDLLQHQIVLAEALAEKLNGGGKPDLSSVSDRNKIMEVWSDGTRHQNGSYSSAYRSLIQAPEFSRHPRFQGNPLAVTLEDVEYFLENRELPN